MRDELVRAITADGLVKAVAVTGRDLVCLLYTARCV